MNKVLVKLNTQLKLLSFEAEYGQMEDGLLLIWTADSIIAEIKEQYVVYWRNDKE